MSSKKPALQITHPLVIQPVYKGDHIFVYHPYKKENEPYSGVYLGEDNLKIHLEEDEIVRLELIKEIDDTITIDNRQYTITNIKIIVNWDSEKKNYIWYWQYTLKGKGESK